MRSTALLLILALASTSLVGCGSSGVTYATGAPRIGMLAARGAAGLPQDGTSLAQAFLTALGDSYPGTPALNGAQVVLQDADGHTTTYDFSQAGTTGMVLVNFDGFRMPVPLDEVMASAQPDSGQASADFLPLLLGPIAIDVAIAGAEGLAAYYIGHHGGDFNKGDAVKASLVAMGTALIPFLGSLEDLAEMAPVALHVLETANSLSGGDLAEAALASLSEIVPVVYSLIKKARSHKKQAPAPSPS